MATTVNQAEIETKAATEPDFPPHRMTIDRYERLVAAGVYGANDPVFLWQGRLVENMGKGRPHVIAALGLFHLLHRLMPENYHVEQDAPIAIGEDSMPEPDLAVVRGLLHDYRERAPSARQVALIVEVADSSLALDTRTKLLAYAADGIPVYWIVNIPQSRIEVYSDPIGPPESAHYQNHRDYGTSDEIPVILDGREVGRIAVRDVLP